MSTGTDRHKMNFRKWVADQERLNATRREGRKTALSSAKEQMTQEMIHTIEKEVKMKKRSLERRSFTGFIKSW